MNYEQLFSFAAFADKLNFTRAAEDLHISQPALHVQIKKLSEAVGVPLYVRSGRALALTRQGRELAAFARSVKQQERDVLGELRGESGGPVVLAAGQGAFLYLLGRAIKRFPKERWPLQLLTRRGPEALAAVREARAQLGVAVLDRDPADLEVTRLCSVGQVAVMRREHPLAARRRLSAASLDGQALVVAPPKSPHRVMLEQAMKTAGAALAVGVEATGWELMLEFAKNGMGIAVVNDFCPVPRGCVAVPVRGLPRASYTLFGRATSNQATRTLRRLIVEATATGSAL